jgi:hypothetical protein
MVERFGFQQQVEALQKLADDSKTHAELGKRLVKEVARAVMEEKEGLPISEPDVEIPIMKGDLVPDQLRAQIPTDAQGRALNDTLVQSLNLRIWLRIWIRFWLRIIVATPQFATTPTAPFLEFADQVRFTPEESTLITRLKRITEA